MSIRPIELEFLNEARGHFEKNPENYTYRNKDDDWIALRCNTDIQIYRLDGEVGYFASQLPNHEDKTNKLKQLLNDLYSAADELDVSLSIGDDLMIWEDQKRLNKILDNTSKYLNK